MANPRKPSALKALQGTDRPSRSYPEPDFPPAENVARPDWLSSPEAVTEWDRLVALLQASRVLTDADLSALAHLCNLHGACVQLYRANLKPHAADLTQLRLFYAEFGLTPASRSKAGKVAESPAANPFGVLTGT